MKTELIVATSPAITKKGAKMIVITTDKGNTIWAPEEKFESAKDTVSFEFHPKGSAYKTKDGADATSDRDINLFIGQGKVSAFDTLRQLFNLGFTPAVNLV